jgi:aerobic carbon-monoxide dehydrogenase large subunit
LIERASRVAGHLLEADASDVRLDGAGFSVLGVPGRTVSWKQVARAAYGSLPPGEEVGLEVNAFFRATHETWSFGVCVAVVRVDLCTGRVRLERLVAVDDCGIRINPLLIGGQVHGGLAQAAGQALMERIVFDEQAQVLSGSLGDYALPRAADLPAFELGHTETPSPYNPLGVKGVGESGAVGAPPAIANAVLDALRPLGVKNLDMPFTPERVWQAVSEARGQ